MTADAQESHALALRPGVLLADRFRLVRSVRGTSPFAFSYHAEDLTTGDSVVVKEFFPRSLVSRGSDGIAVRAHSAECERDFLRALHRFALEGAVLAESSHPNLVRTRAVVDANATVYLVMEHRETQPLADYLRGKGGRIASAEAGRFAQQLLSALQVLHTESIIHRDLSPRSVHVGADGSAVLLEFSARRHLPVHASDLAAGFAAFEQYGMRDIGPWTDVYAISALLHYMLTGSVPPSALDRAAGEPIASPISSVQGIAPALARLVLKGMSLLPQQRPHAVSELRRQLDVALAESVNAPSRNTPNTVGAEAPSAELTEAIHEGDNTEYERSVPLRLAAGGIVLPGEERGIRLLRMLGTAATRFRRSMTPRISPAPRPAEAEENEPRPPRAAARPVEVQRTVVSQTPAAVVEAPSFAATSFAEIGRAPTQADEEESRDLASQIAMATEATDSLFDRENSRRRYSIAAAAALVLVVGSALVLLARNSRASGISAQEAVAPAGVANIAPKSTPATTEAHVAVEGGGALLQSASRASSTAPRADADSPAAAKRPATGREASSASAPGSRSVPQAPAVIPATTRMPNVTIAISGGAADLKIVPPELLVDPRTRLTNGEDQVEQGEYVVARRTFRSAIVELDSAAARYPASEAIKSLKRELVQADTRAVQACAAENEMRKHRGEQARACQ